MMLHSVGYNVFEAYEVSGNQIRVECSVSNEDCKDSKKLLIVEYFSLEEFTFRLKKHGKMFH